MIKLKLHALLALLLLPLSAAQAQFTYFTYTTNAGAITITGYLGPGGIVTIPAAITGLAVANIGGDAFLDSMVTTVAVPDSVTAIGADAFEGCFELSGVYFNGNAPSADSSAFLNDIATVYYLSGTTGWGTNLGGLPTAVWMPFAYTNINGTVTITGYTGYGGAVNLPSEIDGMPVTAIGALAFASSHALASITIPDSVVSIGSAAFIDCPGLTNVSIPDTVTNIGSFAFQSCLGLANVTLPRSVTSIGTAVFLSCNSLTTITVDAQNPVFSSVNGVLFQNNKTTLVEYSGGLSGNYTIPGSVTTIADYAFAYCRNLASMIIPDSVTSIGVQAFAFCPRLTNATFAGGVTNIGQSAFQNSGLATITLPGSVSVIGESAFESCTRLTNAILTEGVSSIGMTAFSDTRLSNLTIPASVTNIGVAAFSFCNSLVGIFFKGNMPMVDNAFDMTAFEGDNNPTVYYLPGTTGWTSTFSGAPAVLWNAQIQSSGANFGLRSNQFGFDITGTTNIPAAVEATADLANPGWIPLQSIRLTNGLFHFSEPLQTNSPSRFYRLSPP